jgi:hypothetical protein
VFVCISVWREGRAPVRKHHRNEQERGKSGRKKKSGVKTLDWKIHLFEKDKKVSLFPISCDGC